MLFPHIRLLLVASVTYSQEITNYGANLMPSGAQDDTDIDGTPALPTTGLRCVDKIEMTQFTEYDDEVICEHRYNKQCYESYVTKYKPEQKEQCTEEFVKNCHIEYKKTAQQEKVTKCAHPLVCGGQGPEVCRREYTTACETRRKVHEVDDDVVNCKTEFEESCYDVTQGYSTTTECKTWPKVKCSKKTKRTQKSTPITECRTVPINVCGPEKCLLEKGEEFCVDDIQMVINQVSFVTYCKYERFIAF